MVSLEDDARHYLSVQLGGTDVSAVPFESIKACIEQSYEGGWVSYEADFNRIMSMQPSSDPVLTAFQKWAKLPNIVGGPRDRFLLRPHQEVISVDIADTEIKAVIRIAKTEEKHSRDFITYGMRLIVWHLTDDKWESQSLDVWTEDAEEMVRFGRVRTAEWVASQREQYETCYRPGTKKSPLQGPAARLGVTREEFHNLPKGK